MPRVLILSSYVAASRVGGMAQALALSALGVEPVLAPTVLFGRHPGLGAPGGGGVSAETFEGVLEGVRALGDFARLDAVITGYFASPAQVRAAAATIDAARAARPDARIIVDPTIGDTAKGLYVPAQTADAVVAELLPRADLIAPNAWELGHITGRTIGDAAGARQAAADLGKPVLVSSIPHAEGVGVVYADVDEAWMAVHARADHAPNGTGDLLTALFAAALIAGEAPVEALARAAGGVASAVFAAEAAGVDDLTAPALSQAWPGLRIERLGGAS
jgi:pyridoxine kinase